jgi:hypothetical protein
LQKEDTRIPTPMFYISLPIKLMKLAIIVSIIVMIICGVSVALVAYSIIKKDEEVKRVQIEYMARIIEDYKNKNVSYFEDGRIGK